MVRPRLASSYAVSPCNAKDSNPRIALGHGAAERGKFVCRLVEQVPGSGHCDLKSSSLFLDLAVKCSREFLALLSRQSGQNGFGIRRRTGIGIGIGIRVGRFTITGWWLSVLSRRLCLIGITDGLGIVGFHLWLCSRIYG